MRDVLEQGITALISGLLFCVAVGLLMFNLSRVAALKNAVLQAERDYMSETGIESESGVKAHASDDLVSFRSILADLMNTGREYDIRVDGYLFKAGIIPEGYPECLKPSNGRTFTRSYMLFENGSIKEVIYVGI